MRIGLDLDGTVYAYPEFFRAFINAMHAQGHQLFVISGHGRDRWEPSDIPRLRALGIDTGKLSAAIMPKSYGIQGEKIAAINQCDFAFDDSADSLQPHTKVPIFRAPTF